MCNSAAESGNSSGCSASNANVSVQCAQMRAMQVMWTVYAGEDWRESVGLGQLPTPRRGRVQEPASSRILRAGPREGRRRACSRPSAPGTRRQRLCGGGDGGGDLAEAMMYLCLLKMVSAPAKVQQGSALRSQPSNEARGVTELKTDQTRAHVP